MSSIPFTPTNNVSDAPIDNTHTAQHNLPMASKNTANNPMANLAHNHLASLPLKVEQKTAPFPLLPPNNILPPSSNALLNNSMLNNSLINTILPQPINGVLPRPPMPFQAHLQLVTSALMLINNLEKDNPEFQKVYAHHLDLIKQSKTTGDLEKYYFLIFALKYREQHKDENILPEIISKLTFMANNADYKLPDCIDSTGGVVFDEFWGSGNSISGRPLGRWVACWEHNGRFFRRGFPVAVFGYNGAKEMAENYWVERKRAMQLSAHNMDAEGAKAKKKIIQNNKAKPKPHEDVGDLLKFDQVSGQWYFESLEGRQTFNTQREASEAFRAMKSKVLKSYTECPVPGVNFEKTRVCWCVTHWVPSKQVRRNRYFNVNKYGWKRAKALAITYKKLSDSMEGEEPSDKLVFEQADPNNVLPSFIIAILEEIKYKPLSISEDRHKSLAPAPTPAFTDSAEANTVAGVVEQTSSEMPCDSASAAETNHVQTLYGGDLPRSIAPSPVPSSATSPTLSSAVPSNISVKSEDKLQQQHSFQQMHHPYSPYQNLQQPFMNSVVGSNIMNSGNGYVDKPSIRFIQQGSHPYDGEWEVRWVYAGNEMNRKFSTYHMGPENAKKMAFMLINQLQSQHLPQ